MRLHHPAALFSLPSTLVMKVRYHTKPPVSNILTTYQVVLLSKPGYIVRVLSKAPNKPMLWLCGIGVPFSPKQVPLEVLTSKAVLSVQLLSRTPGFWLPLPFLLPFSCGVLASFSTSVFQITTVKLLVLFHRSILLSSVAKSFSGFSSW